MKTVLVWYLECSLLYKQIFIIGIEHWLVSKKNKTPKIIVIIIWKVHVYSQSFMLFFFLKIATIGEESGWDQCFGNGIKLTVCCR